MQWNEWLIYALLVDTAHREEVCGGCAFDIPPIYPLPVAHLPPLPSTSPISPSGILLGTFRKWNMLFPSRTAFMHIFHDFYIVNCMIVQKMPTIWDDPYFLGLCVNPLLHKLLAGATPAEELHGGRLEMAVRLAVLVYLADIRVRFMGYHVTGSHFGRRLKVLIVLDAEAWRDFWELRLWILVVGGMKAEPGERGVFVREIETVMREVGLRTWSQVVRVLEGVVWIEDVYGKRCEELGREVVARLEI